MQNTIITTFIALLLFGCGKPDSPQHIIIANIAALEEGIEQKDPDQVLERIHENFRARSGTDKLWVKRTMAFYMLRHPNIEIVTSGMNIELEPEQEPVIARAHFSALVTGGKGLIPEQGAIYQIETEWRLQNDEWQLIYADWRRP